MAHIQADRVKETSTTTGTGNVTLAGAVSAFKTFASRMANDDTTFYCIEHQSADEWEVGLGTFVSATPALARTTVLQSSNSDAAVSFSAGTKHVFITLPSIMGDFGSVTAAPSANQNDYSPTGMNLASNLLIGPTASIKLTGLAGGVEGRRVSITNTASDFLLWLENENTSSSAANRFALPNLFPLFLMPGDFAEFVYLNSRWRHLGGSSPGTMGLLMFDDFGGSAGTIANNGCAGLLGVTISGAGSAAGNTSNGVDSTNDPMGTVTLDTGTATTGRSCLGSGGATGAGTIVPAQGPGIYVARVRINTANSGTETYTTACGFVDGGDGSHNHGVAWEYRWNGAAVEWSQTRWAATAATRSATGSPTPDTTPIWVVIFMNAAWSRADMIYSQDGVAFTKADSPTTGLPSSSQPVGVGVAHIKSAGTTSRLCNVDLVGWRVDYVRP